MVTAYADPNTVEVPATGDIAPASLGTTYRDNFELLARNKCAADLSLSSAQAIANNTRQAVAMDTESKDVGGLHSTSSLTTRATIPAGGDGFYLVLVLGEWAGSNTTGRRQIEIRKGGSAILGVQAVPGSASPQAMSCGVLCQLVAGDFIEMTAFQDSGGSVNMNASNFYSPKLQLIWLGL